MSKQVGSPPDVIQQLIHGFQYDTNVDIPGPNGKRYTVTIGLLWDDEIRELQRDIGFRISSHDFVSRELETKFETVIRATTKIVAVDDGGSSWEVIVPNDIEATRARRMELRALFGKMSRTVDLLYGSYNQLERQRDREYDEALAALKKSTRTPSMPEQIGKDLLESSSSGGDGGNLSGREDS